MGICLPSGAQTRFSFGDSDSNLFRYGNYCDRSSINLSWHDKEHDDGHDGTAPVGSYSPNAFGLYDMHGNVWEWCDDWYDENAYVSRPNPDVDLRDTGAGKYHVLRGGSWFYSPPFCRSAFRRGWVEEIHDGWGGFRVITSDL